MPRIPDAWRSVGGATRRSPEVRLTVAVMKEPDNLCLDILLRESELLWEDVVR